MTELVSGNLLDADAEALVNTVNTVGIMGKGIALQFKQAFPDNFRAYEAAAKRGAVRLGEVFLFHREMLGNPRIIVNFPTKRHWRGKSKIEDIKSGLSSLQAVVLAERIKSVAIPPLGCGNGGLDWDEVRPLILAAFADVPGVRALVYQPAGAPPPEMMRVATKRPSMTPGRAAILGLMHRYALPGYRLSLLEVQKLAYFLQTAGEPLKLDFQKQRYGPYAETLHHVLQRMEGHFIRGYGDRSRSASVVLQPHAIEEAEAFLSARADTRSRLDRVTSLIEGFETPYGMELLASVHWVVAQEAPQAASDGEIAIDRVHAWSDHKRQTFRPEHIRIAWSRLKDHGWY